MSLYADAPRLATQALALTLRLAALESRTIRPDDLYRTIGRAMCRWRRRATRALAATAYSESTLADRTLIELYDAQHAIHPMIQRIISHPDIGARRLTFDLLSRSRQAIEEEIARRVPPPIVAEPPKRRSTGERRRSGASVYVSQVRTRHA